MKILNILTLAISLIYIISCDTKTNTDNSNNVTPLNWKNSTFIVSYVDDSTYQMQQFK